MPLSTLNNDAFLYKSNWLCSALEIKIANTHYKKNAATGFYRHLLLSPKDLYPVGSTSAPSLFNCQGGEAKIEGQPNDCPSERRTITRLEIHAADELFHCSNGIIHQCLLASIKFHFDDLLDTTGSNHTMNADIEVIYAILTLK